MINIIIVALNLIVNLYQGLAMEIYIVKMICFVYLAYCIIRMYKEEKSNINQYYQAILYIYGIVVVVIPVILWIARITRLVISNNEGHQVKQNVGNASEFTSIFSNCIIECIIFSC